MNTVKIRNMVLGEGIPKICVPIFEETKEAVIKEARSITELPADMVEWRADRFENALDLNAVRDMLTELREVLGDLPLLMTFRTSKEGGEKSIEPEDYANINIMAAETGLVDAIDVEVFAAGDEIADRIIEAAHSAGVKVISSSHDFAYTPSKEEIISRLCKMQDMGADVLKIAVMPKDKKDVLTLMSATEEMAREYADRPIITMSMGNIGVVSRIAGGIFGSTLTFGAAAKTSAPGQIGVEELKRAVEIIHDVL
ncbi:MAG: type I 3-dehydroquinate dehydratase [Mogibacterium sp.]|nr:type I 3-dehydroquinate dehydratase [Mogibacterium sp.]